MWIFLLLCSAFNRKTNFLSLSSFKLVFSPATFMVANELSVFLIFIVYYYYHHYKTVSYNSWWYYMLYIIIITIIIATITYITTTFTVIIISSLSCSDFIGALWLLSTCSAGWLLVISENRNAFNHKKSIIIIIIVSLYANLQQTLTVLYSGWGASFSSG